MISTRSSRAVWLVALALGIAIVVAVYGVATIRFELNDDWLIEDVLSGRFTGTCQAHVIFLHIWLGQALAWLYCTFPSVEWYVVCLLLCHVLEVLGSNP